MTPTAATGRRAKASNISSGESGAASSISLGRSPNSLLLREVSSSTSALRSCGGFCAGSFRTYEPRGMKWSRSKTSGTFRCRGIVGSGSRSASAVGARVAISHVSGTHAKVPLQPCGRAERAFAMAGSSGSEPTAAPLAAEAPAVQRGLAARSRAGLELGSEVGRATTPRCHTLRDAERPREPAPVSPLTPPSGTILEPSDT